MSFSVKEFHGLVELLEKRPEWRAELRRLVLSDEVLALPEIVSRLSLKIDALVEAQQRTEERVDELAAAQARTTQAISQMREIFSALISEQSHAIRELTDGLDRMRKQVGGLSESLGGDIEDIAYIVLHDVLQREFGWKVGVLERSWVTWDGEPEEVNVLGMADDPTRPGKNIWIVGEAKHNLTIKEVEHFVKQADRARQNLQGEIFPVCFCYRARPEVQEAMKAAGLRLVFSYGKLV